MRGKQKFTAKIGNKLILTFVALTIISLVLLSLIVHNKVVRQTKKDYTNAIFREVTQVDNGVGNYVSVVKENIGALAKDSIITNMTNPITSYVDKKGENGEIKMTPLANSTYEADVYKYFESYKNSQSFVQAICMASSENGGYIQYPLSPLKDGYDPRTRDWYKTAISSPDKISLTDAYVSTTGQVSLSILSTIKDANKAIKGVIGVDINLGKLTEIIKKIKVGENGYIVLLDKNGTILAHPKQPELVTKNMSELKIGNLNSIGENGTEKKLSDGKKYLISAKKSNNNDLNWNYLICIEKGEFLKSANSIGVINLILITIFSIISIFVSVVISRKISNPINGLSNQLKLLGEGDFTVDIPKKYLESEDELGYISNSANKMQSSIREMLSSVKGNSKSIEVQIEKLFKASEFMATHSDEVASSIQDITKKTTSQAERIKDSVPILNRFGDEISEIVKVIREVESSSKGINSMASNNNDDMKSLIDSVKNIDGSFNVFADRIMELSKNINQISEITNLINDIAEQTNLLALNAAIEAARAGESGRGFAVVADEIRKLAEQSKKSSESINQLTESISKNTDCIVTDSKSMNEELNNQIHVINNTVESFKNIISSVSNIIPKVEKANNSISSIDKQKNDILDNIENISEIAREVSTSSEEVAVSSEKLSSFSNDVASSTNILNNTSKEMIEDINKFKL